MVAHKSGKLGLLVFHQFSVRLFIPAGYALSVAVLSYVGFAVFGITSGCVQYKNKVNRLISSPRCKRRLILATVRNFVTRSAGAVITFTAFKSSQIVS